MEKIDLGLGLRDTHVLVTGAGGLIGSRAVAAFLEAGCKVSALDVSQASLSKLKDELSTQKSTYPASADVSYHAADVSSEESMASAYHDMQKWAGTIQCCVALAALDLSVLDHRSIVDMPVSQFQHTIDVNLIGTFITAKIWLTQLSSSPDAGQMNNKSLIIIGSESGLLGERLNADYATSKSAVQGGLLLSLKGDVPRKVPGTRVNAIAPGPVDTARFRQECSDNSEQFWLDCQAT
ncbi:MAG: hypothetical protein Q9159_005453 [Coniocarpon cinnabarinum]